MKFSMSWCQSSPLDQNPSKSGQFNVSWLIPKLVTLRSLWFLGNDFRIQRNAFHQPFRSLWWPGLLGQKPEKDGLGGHKNSTSRHKNPTMFKGKKPGFVCCWNGIRDSVRIQLFFVFFWGGLCLGYPVICFLDICIWSTAWKCDVISHWLSSFERG